MDEIENTASAETTTQAPVEQTEAPATGMRAAFEAAKEQLEGKTDTKPEVKLVPDSKPQDTPTPSPPVTALTAPKHWTAERQTVFARLDPDAQAAWLSHDKDWERGLNEKANKFKPAVEVYDAIQAAIDPGLRSEMKQRNISEGQVVSALIAMGRELDANPMAFIAKTMQRHKIDPRVFLQQDGGQTAQNGNIQSLLPVIQPLLSKVQELEQGQRAWKKQQEKEAAKRTETTITSFRGEKDASGALKYPYVERVVETMAELIESNPRYSNLEAHDMLEQAYNAAVVLDPTIRAEIIAAEASKQIQAMQQTSQAARLNNSKTVKPATSASGTKSEKRGLRGAYDDAKAQLGH